VARKKGKKMKSEYEEKQDRREFFRTCTRHTALAAVALTCGKLLTRKPRDKQSHQCVNQGICDGCHAFSTCSLPQALSAKQEMAVNRLVNNPMISKE
jgi:hypothetical protein